MIPVRFLGLVPKPIMAEMLAHTYAESKNVDPNEAYERLDVALKDLKLIEGLQRATWASLLAKKPQLAEKELVEHVAKRLEKARRFKAFKPKRAESGALAAVMVLIDTGSGYATGEARELLHTPEGEKLLATGFALLGAHLAAEMLR